MIERGLDLVGIKSDPTIATAFDNVLVDKPIESKFANIIGKSLQRDAVSLLLRKFPILLKDFPVDPLRILQRSFVNQSGSCLRLRHKTSTHGFSEVHVFRSVVLKPFRLVSEQVRFLEFRLAIELIDQFPELPSTDISEEHAACLFDSDRVLDGQVHGIDASASSLRRPANSCLQRTACRIWIWREVESEILGDLEFTEILCGSRCVIYHQRSALLVNNLAVAKPPLELSRFRCAPD